jgi:hypothetical protein
MSPNLDSQGQQQDRQDLCQGGGGGAIDQI